MKILLLGANGMIGSTLFRFLSESSSDEVWGTVRCSRESISAYPLKIGKIFCNVDATNYSIISDQIENLRPDVVINCIGLTKHRKHKDYAPLSIMLNSLLPYQLAESCIRLSARLIHISSDCVFIGSKGNYKETDPADALDIYGKTKSLGEISAPNTVILRTSTIGHELETSYGLLEWFLSQHTKVRGFTRAVFSGLPTIVLAQVIRNIVLPNRHLNGLFHVSAEPINKFELLGLIAKTYNKKIIIEPSDELVIDRSLDSSLFFSATGYRAPDWDSMIKFMHNDSFSVNVRR